VIQFRCRQLFDRFDCEMDAREYGSFFGCIIMRRPDGTPHEFQVQGGSPPFLVPTPYYERMTSAALPTLLWASLAELERSYAQLTGT
jgi:hypothetical protein